MSAWWLLPAFIAGFLSCPPAALVGGWALHKRQDKRRAKAMTIN